MASFLALRCKARADLYVAFRGMNHSAVPSLTRPAGASTRSCLHAFFPAKVSLE